MIYLILYIGISFNLWYNIKRVDTYILISWRSLQIKELALQVIQSLPDNVSDEEIAEALLLIGSIMKGYKQAEDGRSITTEELLKEIAEL